MSSATSANVGLVCPWRGKPRNRHRGKTTLCGTRHWQWSGRGDDALSQVGTRGRGGKARVGTKGRTIQTDRACPLKARASVIASHTVPGRPSNTWRVAWMLAHVLLLALALYSIDALLLKFSRETTT